MTLLAQRSSRRRKPSNSYDVALYMYNSTWSRPKHNFKFWRIGTVIPSLSAGKSQLFHWILLSLSSRIGSPLRQPFFFIALKSRILKIGNRNKETPLFVDCNAKRSFPWIGRHTKFKNWFWFYSSFNAVLFGLLLGRPRWQRMAMCSMGPDTPVRYVLYLPWAEVQ